MAAVLLALGSLALAFHYLAAGIVLVLIAAAIIAGFWFWVVRRARLPKNAVVMLHLGGEIHEDSQHAPLLQMLRGAQAPSLHHLRYALEAIADDPGVRAVVVQVGGLQAGLATAHELHRLLAAVRARGKRVIAVIAADSPSIRDYLAACGAGEVVANPDVMFTMLGVAMGNPFLRDALEKAGVRAQTLQWKEYKGAGEMLSRDSMSQAVRESLDAIIADWLDTMTHAVAQARGMSEERARELLSGGFMSAQTALGARLIDRAGYIEDIRAELDPGGQRKCFVNLNAYLRHTVYRRERGPRPAIALIFGAGPVITGEPPMSGEFISGESTSEMFERASRSDNVRAVVFRVNSPGGSAVGSDLVWRSVREAQGRGKPVVVSMGDVAGSGGYYVAMGADAIVAEPTTITGSIGVVFAKFDLSAMLSKVGVRFDFAKSGASGDALSISRGLSDDELSQMNAAIGEVYGNFTAKVAEGRRLSPEDAESLAKGRVWSGIAARDRGLVDDLGGLARAIEIARERAHIPPGQPHQIVTFSPPQRFSLRMLASQFSAAPEWGGADLFARVVGVPRTWAPAMLRLLVRGGAMLLCPWLG